MLICVKPFIQFLPLATTLILFILYYILPNLHMYVLLHFIIITIFIIWHISREIRIGTQSETQLHILKDIPTSRIEVRFLTVLHSNNLDGFAIIVIISGWESGIISNLIGMHKEHLLKICNCSGQASYFHEEVKVIGVECGIGGRHRALS